MKRFNWLWIGAFFIAIGGCTIKDYSKEELAISVPHVIYFGNFVEVKKSIIKSNGGFIMSKVKVNGVEMDTESTTYANMVIDEIINSVILEAVNCYPSQCHTCRKVYQCH